MAIKHVNGFKVWAHMFALMVVVAVVAVGVSAQGGLPSITFPNVPRNPVSFGSGPSTNLGPRANVGLPVRPNTRPPAPMQPRPVSRTPPMCAQQGQEFCEVDPEYPRDHIRSLLSRRASLVNLFRDPVLRNVLSDPEVSVPEQPVTRFGITETPACKATETLIYPQTGKMPNDDWVFIVNDESVKQAVRVEKCTKENSSCEFGNNLPQSIDATCRQKFIYKKLLVLDNTNNISSESVLMPSCCVCYIKRSENNISSRNRPAFTRRFPSTEDAFSTSGVPQPSPATDGRNFNFPNNG